MRGIKTTVRARDEVTAQSIDWEGLMQSKLAGMAVKVEHLNKYDNYDCKTAKLSGPLQLGFDVALIPPFSYPNYIETLSH